MAGGEQIGGNADCAVFAGAVGGGDCGGGEGIVIILKSRKKDQRHIEIKINFQ